MANRAGRPTTRQPGDKHHKLTLIETTLNAGRRGWKCKCDCGNFTFVRFDSFKSTKSCGCLRVENGKQRVTHGQLKTPAYSVWQGMKKRCKNKNHPAYKNYGGRGIDVSESWLKFENFIADMGHPQPGMQLDRIDNNAGYSKENCRWATPKQNARNRRTNVNFNGMTLAEAAERSGHSIQVISWRIHRLGMTIEEAMTAPKMRVRKT